MSNKVELLAPAGNMECFYAAVHAGADAVYLAGEKFGARAYADNFTTEEVCSAIRYGHLFHVKTYLTLNTLIKEREFDEVYPYVCPFYEAGLDGVIVQDLGVVSLLKEAFPDMEIHASTQMTVTGANGAKLLKEYGVKRVVPARELSLDELQTIKQDTGMEMEIFIHGAMCYAYSGQCLFSSVLGGRSGNRGRCAGPCRLPYQIYEDDRQLNQKGQDYPLSLKDLCTIQLLPQLINAGMDSFKIEGRMKSAEYVAVVTAIYRKYIDIIYALRNKDGKLTEEAIAPYHVDKEDISLLKKLYVRTNLQDGYFYKQNGAELVTLQKPSYTSIGEEELIKIRERFFKDTDKLPVSMHVTARIGKQIELRLWHEEYAVCVKGDCVETAQKRAMTEADIQKQLSKLGNTPFRVETFVCESDDNIFIPVKALNELRRSAVLKLMDMISPCRKPSDYTPQQTDCLTEQASGHCLIVSVDEMEQFHAVKQFSHKMSALFLSYHVLEALLSQYGRQGIVDELQIFRQNEVELYFLLPRVMRRRTSQNCLLLWQKFGAEFFTGIVTNSLEGLALFNNIGKKCIADAGLYSFNRRATEFLTEHGIQAVTLPYECNYHELLELKPSVRQILTIYTYLPLMESAGCVAKTMSVCKGKNAIYKMKDRYNKIFFVKSHCDRCDNTIYNSVPMNLMGEWNKLTQMKVDFRIDFTIESAKEVKDVLNAYESLHNTDDKFIPKGEYTKGYFKRGVE